MPNCHFCGDPLKTERERRAGQCAECCGDYDERPERRTDFGWDEPGAPDEPEEIVEVEMEDE